MAAPFGIAFGSTPDREQYFVSFKHVAKPHPLFRNVSGMWSPETGLYQIAGSSDIYEYDPYGQNISSDYNTIQAQLTKFYGSSSNLEYLCDGAIYSDPRDFLESIARNERVHASLWDRSTGAYLPELMESVYLSICMASDWDAQLMLVFSCINQPTTVEADLAEVL
jgi:hypothetical protein